MTLEEMLEISTTTYVTADDPPTFLCVGERDKQFRVNQMARLARKCRKIGVEYQFVIQPDMPHQYIDDPAVIGRIFTFLDKHLK
jgi:dipeptidyl aminopeptidase/acylaminoacyl peptidase